MKIPKPSSHVLHSPAAVYGVANAEPAGASKRCEVDDGVGDGVLVEVPDPRAREENRKAWECAGTNAAVPGAWAAPQAACPFARQGACRCCSASGRVGRDPTQLCPRRVAPGEGTGLAPGRPMMGKRGTGRRPGYTVARRMCAACRRHLGFALWTWSGSVFVTSHGLCRRCVLHLRATS
jgi:hypothetical protein